MPEEGAGSVSEYETVNVLACVAATDVAVDVGATVSAPGIGERGRSEHERRHQGG